MMNMPQEAVGAVPQPGVNPQARQAPQAPPRQAQPAQNPQLSPEQINSFRSDPELIAAVSMFIGKQVQTLDGVPDELMVQIAGMVHKLGVEGAVAEARKNLPPQVQHQLQQAVQ